MAASAAVWCNTLAAQAGATGTITGTIANAATRQFLNQAEVRVQNTDLATLTDSEGRYRLSGVPAGPRVVVVNYLGLKAQEAAVTVTGGSTVTRDFELSSDVYVLEKLVVATDREGQAAALNQQRNADYMKSVVASDAFGELHDNNAAELLKSIPGMALDYSGEDAIGFTMRGQDSTYATITTDGNPAASGANNGPSGRNVNFRNVSVNNIESVEINRAPSAAQPANSLGGSVNFVSKSAFSQKGRRVRLDFGANFNTDAARLDRTYQGLDHESYTVFPAFQLNFSDTLRAESAHPIGVVFNASLGGRYLYNYNFARAYTYVPPIPAGQRVSAAAPAIASSLALREASAGWRQRGLSVNIDYKLSERSTIFLRASYQEGPQYNVYGLNNSMTMTAANQTAGAGAAITAINGNSATTIDSRPNATPVPAGSSTGSRIAKTSGSAMADNQWNQYSGGAKHQWGDLGVTYNLYYGRAFDRRDPSGAPNTGTLTYDVTNVGFTLQGLQDPDTVMLRQTAGPDYRNIANYGRVTWVSDTRFSLDRRWGGKIDVRRDFSGWRVPFVFQAGLVDDTQCRITTGVSTGARRWFGTGPDGVFGNADDVALPLAQFRDSRMDGRWRLRGPTDNVEVGQWIDIKKLFDHAREHPEAMTTDAVLDVTAAKAKKVFIEDIFAGYAMGTFRWGRFTVVPGVRWEQTTDSGKGWARANVALPAGLSPAQQAARVEAQYTKFTRKTRYSDYYPNLQAKYAVTPALLFRAAYTEAIGRQNFGTLLPGDNINVTAGTISRNNPDLQPFQARNYDLSAEYYFERSAGNLTASVFRKDISNYFTTVGSILPGGAGNGYEGLYQGFMLTQQVNIPGVTRTDGYEIGYQQSLRFLPGHLRNLIATMSFTHLSSTTPPGLLAVTGIYPDVYFAGLSYVTSRIRVDVKYNLRKQWFTAVNNTTGELTYNRDDGRWDFAFDYRFTRRTQFYLNWRNLTKSNAETFVAGRPINLVGAGSLINTGVRIEF